MQELLDGYAKPLSNVEFLEWAAFLEVVQEMQEEASKG